MEHANQKKIIQVAEAAARRVGAELLSKFNMPSSFEVRFKGPTDVVTEVDIWAEKQISQLVHENFNGHSIIGEESCSASRNTDLAALESCAGEGVCWIVDPIDGTSNFVNGIPLSSVSIGVLENGIPEVGVVYDPYQDELYSAVRGAGAALNGRPLKVSATEQLSHAVVASSFDEWSDKMTKSQHEANKVFIKSSRAYRRFGSAALEFCWIASGRLDAAFEAGLAPWDAAAGVLIVEEAGGVVSNPGHSGRPCSLFKRTFLAANPILHRKMIEIGLDSES